MKYATVYKWVSMYDLERIGYDFKINPPDPEVGRKDYEIEYITFQGLGMTVDTFHKQLWCIGIDTKNVFLIKSSFHRSVQDGERYYGIRFGGLEREDDAWLRSGFASDEIKMKMSRMSDMDDVTYALAHGNREGY